MDLTQQLFQLVFNHLSRSGHITPKFIGQFDGIEALPKGKYPAIYYWIDTQQKNSIRLSLNIPLLQSVCERESTQAGIVIHQQIIDDALERLRDFCTTTLQKKISKWDQ